MSSPTADSSSKPSDNPQLKEALEFLTSIVGSACQFKASDIHIRAEHQIMMRLDGRIRQVKGSPVMSDEMIERLIFPLMSKHHLDLFEQDNQVDLSLSDNDGNRVRVNMFRQLGRLAVVMQINLNGVASKSSESGAVPAYFDHRRSSRIYFYRTAMCYLSTSNWD